MTRPLTILLAVALVGAAGCEVKKTRNVQIYGLQEGDHVKVEFVGADAPVPAQPEKE